MYTKVLTTSTIAALLSLAQASPIHELIQREPQRVSTVTKTVTTREIQTITTCSTGQSSSRPTSSTSKPRIPSTSTTSSSSGTSSSGVPTYDNKKCVWIVPGAGNFKNKDEFTFFDGQLPQGLSASNYDVKDTYNGAPYNHNFDPQNVWADGDFLNLKVPGVSNPVPGQDISSAEVLTTKNNILYASVRTNAIFSYEPGTCAGIFFYKDDSQEIDIEFLSDPESMGNTDSPGVIPLWYSNQAIKANGQATQSTGPAPWDITAVHEYRIDWTKDFTAFYLDGVLQRKYTDNIPTKPGYWIWNNWANGDIGWSAGPPKNDNVMRIQNITMYYNTDSDASACN